MTGKCDGKRRNVVTINATAEFIEIMMSAAHVVMWWLGWVHSLCQGNCC